MKKIFLICSGLALLLTPQQSYAKIKNLDPAISGKIKDPKYKEAVLTVYEAFRDAKKETVAKVDTKEKSKEEIKKDIKKAEKEAHDEEDPTAGLFVLKSRHTLSELNKEIKDIIKISKDEGKVDKDALDFLKGFEAYTKLFDTISTMMASEKEYSLFSLVYAVIRFKDETILFQQFLSNLKKLNFPESIPQSSVNEIISSLQSIMTDLQLVSKPLLDLFFTWKEITTLNSEEAAVLTGFSEGVSVDDSKNSAQKEDIG